MSLERASNLTKRKECPMAPRWVCYVVLLALSVAVVLIAIFAITPFTYISAIVAGAGALMFILGIIGIVLGWPCFLSTSQQSQS
jgi:hypothetical protein